MKQISRVIGISAVPALVILNVHHNGLHYYLDAATGSMIIQALIGGAVAALLAVKIFWGKIKTAFRNLFGGSKSREEPPE
jgi:hypothetical protein